MRFVVAGAGSAGCVLAARLTENPDVEVVLLEAGPDPYPGPLPADLADGTRNSFTAHDWGFMHKPNRAQVRIPLPRGRVMGGSSAVNTCIALRGQPGDYDEWGLPDWTWEKCLPAFRKLENDLDYGDSEIHGGSGPIPMRRHPQSELTTWHRAFVEACLRLGYPECADTNTPHSWGVGPHAMNKLDGRRISAAEGYLTPAVRNRTNLQILPNCHVRRVHFEGDLARAVEVERGKNVEMIAGDTIVLTAGAIATPGILLRSGVGAPAELRHLGVPVHRDVPGVNIRLLDHAGTAMFMRPSFGADTSRHDPMIQTTCRFSSGVYGFPNDIIVQVGASVPTPWARFPLVSLMFMVGKTVGAGRIRWESAHPHHNPVIESNIFDDPTDRRIALDTYDRILEIADTPEIRRLARPFYPSARILRSKKRLDERLAFMCDSGYHPSGTVPMGDERDPDAACSPRGLVRGTENLYVADASLLPTMTTANIHLTVLMMAERIAEWLGAPAP